ncbi:MAG: hypothetical protein M3Q30_05845 [Actinomycetota bacterium]|nr:hypothetical protein [Actinomycetota bacterium]
MPGFGGIDEQFREVPEVSTGLVDERGDRRVRRRGSETMRLDIGQGRTFSRRQRGHAQVVQTLQLLEQRGRAHGVAVRVNVGER